MPMKFGRKALCRSVRGPRKVGGRPNNCRHCGHTIMWYEPVPDAENPRQLEGRWAHLRWHPAFNPVKIGDRICLRKKGTNRPLRNLPEAQDMCKCENAEPNEVR